MPEAERSGEKSGWSTKRLDGFWILFRWVLLQDKREVAAVVDGLRNLKSVEGGTNRESILQII